MRILMIAPNDPAGAAINLRRALAKHAPWLNCRLLTLTRRYNFFFPRDIHVPNLCRVPSCDRAELGPPTRGCVGCERPREIEPEAYDEIRELIAKADVIHFHILADENLTIGPLKVRDHLRPSTECIHHHHGHPDFRAHPEKYRLKYQSLGRRALVSTPDLLKLLPEASWIPNPVPVDDPLYRPIDRMDPGGCLRFGHSPTVRRLKNTDEFLEVVARLQRRFRWVEPTLIEGLPHVECLRMKRDCALFFDHMQGYFGISSLEALSQGIPTFAGLDEWTISHIGEFFGTTDLPWVVVRTAADLEREAAALIEDPEERWERSRLSRAFMESVWTERRIAEGLVSFYAANEASPRKVAHG